jgi:hypothetical protein
VPAHFCLLLFVIQHAEFSLSFTLVYSCKNKKHTDTPPWSSELLFKSQAKQEIINVSAKSRTSIEKENRNETVLARISHVNVERSQNVCTPSLPQRNIQYTAL